VRVRIKYYGSFKDITNLSEEIFELKGTEHNLKSLVAMVSKKYGSKFADIIINPRTNEYREGIVILFNELKGDLDQKIKDGDVISFLPMVTGG